MLTLHTTNPRLPAVTTLSPTAERYFRDQAAAEHTRPAPEWPRRQGSISSLLAEIGFTAISGDNGAVIIFGEAYFDSNGCGPYDRAEL